MMFVGVCMSNINGIRPYPVLPASDMTSASRLRLREGGHKLRLPSPEHSLQTSVPPHVLESSLKFVSPTSFIKTLQRVVTKLPL